MNKIKVHLSTLLYYLDIEKDELYNKTGYNYDDVKTKEDLQEVIRLFDLWYYIPEYLKNIDNIK